MEPNQMTESECEILGSALIEAAPDAILAVNAQGCLIIFNTSAEELFGYSRDEVLGRDVGELIVPSEFRSAHAKGFALHIAKDDAELSVERAHLEALHADGSRIPIEISLRRLPMQSMKVVAAYIRG